MDSREVNIIIKNKIWSFLKEQGFIKFTTRNAWRYNIDTIEVINFQSLNSYLAGSLGCTTYSFSVNLGIYFSQIPHTNIKVKEGYLVPEEYDCLFRRSLTKSLRQSGFKRKDIWFISTSGDNLELVIDDVKEVLTDDGLKWFGKYSDMNAVIETLLNEEENLDGTWGFGRKSSPNRNFLCGYIAYFLQKYELASVMLENAINSECFDNLREILQRDYESIKEKMYNN